MSAAKNLPQLMCKETIPARICGAVTRTREDRMDLNFAFIATPRVIGVRAANSGFPLG
ncbi:hypothetical protein [Afipia sp. Root123D2]|uniref:hypothetical protein n=1 Tax=Afipia sp. Root123D2 TaxID=1736436 RepID=UPI000AAD1759|nr:hypothetical protein [Afipia sp. Root123D2]